MATKPPNIKKSEPRPGNPNQPPARNISNEPGKTLTEALANGKRAVEAANKQ